MTTFIVFMTFGVIAITASALAAIKSRAAR
jgi:hypothetical protein